MTSIVTISLRLITAALRFLLIIYIEKNYNSAVLGEFSLYSSLITVGGVFFGMELHYVLSRLISKASYQGQRDLISAEFSVFIRLYLVAIILGFVIYLFDQSYIFYILIILLIIAEHISLEILRSVQAAFMPVFSTFILFIRSVAWFLILITVDQYFNSIKSLEKIILIWAITSIVFSTILIFFLRWLKLLKFSKILLIRHRLIRILFTRAQPFYITAIIFGVSQYFDRFFIGALYGVEAVGKYFFVASLASVLNLFVTYSVSVVWGPRVVKAFKTSTKVEFKQFMRDLRIRYYKWGLLGFICALILFHPFIYAAKLGQYDELYIVFVVLIFGNLVIITSDYFNLYLYAGQCDWIMFYIVLKCSLLSLLFMAILVPSLGLLGAAIGFILTQCVFCYFRAMAAYKEGLL
jgi:O-antigen/teichoic acid export membrane protein